VLSRQERTIARAVRYRTASDARSGPRDTASIGT
jgi:hypothetical protein